MPSIFSHRPESLTEDSLLMFDESVTKFLSTHATEDAMAQWRHDKAVARSLWAEAAKAGFLCLGISEEYGGAGLDFRYEAVFAEAIHRHGLDAFGAPLHNAIVAPYIEAYGTEEQKQRWLPKMAQGELIGAIAMTEPGAGSDLRGIKTNARRDGGDYVINGSKTFITNGQTADLIIVAVKTGEGQQSNAISLVVVETANAPGFSRGRNLDKLGLEAADTSELFFNDMRVPVGNLLGGEEGRGLPQLMQKLPQERLLIALDAIGGIERALTHTIAYVKERKAFGQAIADFQNTQFKLAECKTEANVARVFADHCILRLVNNDLDTTTASMAKYWITDLHNKIVDQCLQLFGGFGYMLEYPI
ncbi:MAG: acyl-CoA dehydrogenase family protein, partial [Caulobacterales bacterium]